MSTTCFNVARLWLMCQPCYNKLMKSYELSEQDMQLWYMWKGSYQRIFERVINELTEHTGLSEGDYGVLDRLDLLGNGCLRQQELADSMKWDKSRLSHHLTRMEKRGLVARKPLDTERGVQVVITSTGELALGEARPVVSRAIRKHFLDQLTVQDRELIAKLAGRAKESI